ncbi:MAG: LytTR family DNA-binding domain-containing protein [Gelidibacter sp.]
MSISCLIIEDNKAQNDSNKLVVTEHFKEITHIQQAFNLEEAERLLQKSQPDIVLADVHLGDGNVLDAFAKLERITSKLIFTTSYSEYAIDAFKLSAISYLLKPYSDEELIAEIKKTIAQIQHENYHKQMEVFFHNLQAQQQSKRIVLKNHDLIHVVNIDDILYAQADNNYTHFFCENDQKILVSKSLKTFETELAGENFFRCHHSYLINLNKIKALHKSADAVILDNDATVPVASSKKKMLYQLIG